MSDLGYSLVPVDHDPFADQLPPSQGVATTQTTAQPDEIAKLAGQGTYLSIENQKPKVTYDEAKANLYGLTGIPDIQKGAEEIGKGNYLAGIGQAGYGALNAGALVLPAARLAGGVLKEALPAIPGVMRDVTGTFYGLGSPLADRAAYATALDLEKSGVPREDILKQTGWFKGVDQQWRFEGSDVDAALKRRNFRTAQFWDMDTGETLPTPPEKKGALELKENEDYEGPRLGTLLSHPELFKHYPDLAKMGTERTTANEGSWGIGEGWVRGTSPTKWEGMALGQLTPKNMLSTILHESQHAIQAREGFSEGYALNGDENPENYFRTSGEVEARLTEARKDLTAEQRRQIPPWSEGPYGYDRPESDQIVRIREHGEPGLSQSFLGTKARLANLDTQARAKALEDQGMRNEDIRKATGWFRGIDDQWRFEHSDLGGKITGPNYYDAVDRAKRSGNLPTIGDLYSDPKLWENYPELAQFKVQELPDKVMGNASAAMSASDKTLYVSSRMMESPDLKKTLLHEIQHAIQNREGFARGGNTSEFLTPAYHERQKDITRYYDAFMIDAVHNKKMEPTVAHDLIGDLISGKKQLDDIDPSLRMWAGPVKENVDLQLKEYNVAHEKYRRLAGEAESRLVEQRSVLGPQSQKDFSPFPINGPIANQWSFDVPPAEQTVRFGASFERKSPMPGVHYLEDKPSSNYVINSPQLIDIVKKHGVGVLHSSGFPLGTYYLPVEHQPDFGSLH